MPTVVLDTSVLIHLDDVRQLGLLRALRGVNFVFPGEVWQELVRDDRRARVLMEVRQGGVRRERLGLGGELLRRLAFEERGLDLGESACCALAQERDWYLATDDHKALREWRAEVGPSRSIATPGLIQIAIRQGILSVEQADAFLPVWAANRFRLNLESFA